MLFPKNTQIRQSSMLCSAQQHQLCLVDCECSCHVQEQKFRGMSPHVHRREFLLVTTRELHAFFTEHPETTERKAYQVTAETLRHAGMSGVNSELVMTMVRAAYGHRTEPWFDVFLELPLPPLVLGG